MRFADTNVRERLPSVEDISREKIKVEIGEFNKWLLKNVETRDKSEPDLTSGKTNKQISSFDKTQLNQTKTVTTAPTHLYVTQV